MATTSSRMASGARSQAAAPKTNALGTSLDLTIRAVPVGRAVVAALPPPVVGKVGSAAHVDFFKGGQVEACPPARPLDQVVAPSPGELVQGFAGIQFVGGHGDRAQQFGAFPSLHSDVAGLRFLAQHPAGMHRQPVTAITVLISPPPRPGLRPGAVAGDQGVQAGAELGHRNSEGYALVPRQRGGIDADDFPFTVDQRAAAAAGVDGRVGLGSAPPSPGCVGRIRRQW